MSATGMPERITRWSPEQRAATQARRMTVRWLWENALVDHRTIQAAMGGRHNATQDLQAAGAQPRWWLHSQDIAANRRHLEGEFYKPGTIPRPPRVPDVIQVSAPTVNRSAVGSWVFANSAETGVEIQRWAGSRLHLVGLACRGRGLPLWSCSALDARFPDATGSGSMRLPGRVAKLRKRRTSNRRPSHPAHGQPLLEDGTVDVRALCKRWDEDANRGAGEPRD